MTQIIPSLNQISNLEIMTTKKNDQRFRMFTIYPPIECHLMLNLKLYQNRIESYHIAERKNNRDQYY